MATPSVERKATEEAFLDAAERLLVEVGHAGITTRRLAQEAGANHGLVHYYFGSMENLLVRVLERFTWRLIARQQAMHSDPNVPSLEKWRTAMRYLDADHDYQKVWWELQALAWNREELRASVARVNQEWRAVLTKGFAEPRERYGIDMPLDALVSLVVTFNAGVILEKLSGIESRHAELLERIDGERGSVNTTETLKEARQTRARYPDEAGVIERDGVPIALEVYGSREPPLLFLPTWSIVHSRGWRMQIPYFARHFRALTFDGSRQR